jgi:O-antigen/teichoic acid export membrane protein
VANPAPPREQGFGGDAPLGEEFFPNRYSFRFVSLLTAGSGAFIYSLSAITGPLLARNLGPAGRGDLAAVTVPTDMLGFFLCFGIPIAAAYYSREHASRHLIMSSWVFAGVVGAAIALASWWAVPWYLQDHAPQTIPWFRAYLIAAIIFVPVQTAIELLIVRGAMVAFNVWRLFPLVVNSLLIVLLALAGHLTLGTALAAGFGTNAVWFIGVLTVYRAWPGRGFRRDALVKQLHYGSRVTVGNIGGLMVSRLDQFMLVGFVSSAQLGFYAVAVTAAGVTMPVSDGLTTALFPRLLRHSSGTPEHASAFGKAVWWAIVASVLCSAGAAAVAPWFIPTLFGSAFRASLGPLFILLPGQCAANVGRVVASKLMADNRPGTASMGLVAAAVVTVIGLLLTVEQYGIYAGAWVTTIAQFTYLGYVSVAVWRRGFGGADTAVADDLEPVSD